MAGTSFPRFLELPTELQIQVWEEAILETVDFASYHSYEKAVFAVYIAWKNYRLSSECMHDGDHSYGPDEKGILRMTVPWFRHIMNTCHFSRFVACQWWRRFLLEPCLPGLGWDGEVEESEEVLKQMDEMIEDLRNKLDRKAITPAATE